MHKPTSGRVNWVNSCSISSWRHWSGWRRWSATTEQRCNNLTPGPSIGNLHAKPKHIKHYQTTAVFLILPNEASYLPKGLDMLPFFQRSGPTSSCCWDVGLVHRRECNTSSRYHSRRLLRANHSEIHEAPQADRHTSKLQRPPKGI